MFSSQKAVALANGMSQITPATLRDVEILKDCERRLTQFGCPVSTVVEEWIATKNALPNVSLTEMAQFYSKHNAGVQKMTLSEVVPLFLEAKKDEGGTLHHLKTLSWQSQCQEEVDVVKCVHEINNGFSRSLQG